MWFVLNSNQGFLFTGITYGVWSWVFVHNLIVSTVLYKTRDSNVSNALKIVFNFSGVGKAVTAMAGILVSTAVNEIDCRIMGYIGMIFNVTFRVSLVAFLLWRLRQIERNKYDLYIGCVLTFASFVLQATTIFLRNITIKEAAPNQFWCDRKDKYPVAEIFWAYFAIGLTNDLYVTARLVYILRKANSNAKLVSTNMRRPHKRTLFTAVMYWNFVRLGCALFYDIVSGVATQMNASNNPPDPAVINFFFAFSQAALSYAVTADAEIVRAVEGRPFVSKTSGSTGSAPPKSSHATSTSKSFGSYSSPTSTVYKPGANGVEEKETLYASMKRLSFFEWATVVTGFGRRNSRLREAQQHLDDETDVHEDAIERVSDRNAGDLEQGNTDVERRGSTFSGETVTNVARPESVGQAL